MTLFNFALMTPWYILVAALAEKAAYDLFKVCQIVFTTCRESINWGKKTTYLNSLTVSFLWDKDVQTKHTHTLTHTQTHYTGSQNHIHTFLCKCFSEIWSWENKHTINTNGGKNRGSALIRVETCQSCIKSLNRLSSHFQPLTSSFQNEAQS